MPVPDFTLPLFGRRWLQRLPATPPAWLLVHSLNQLQKRQVLAADMSLLSGKTFAVEICDAGLTLTFRADEERFHTGSSGDAPDLRLAANLADFLRLMLREEDPDTLFFSRRLRIEGDTELGLIVKNLLDSVDWDSTPLRRFMQH